MKTSTIAIIVIAVIVIGGIAVYAMTQSNNSANTNTENVNATQDDTMMEENANADTMMEENVNADDGMMEENTNQTSAAPAQYVEYSDAALAQAQAVEGGKTVLYFHANWCPVCKALDPDITANISTLPEGLTLLKVDYDTATALKAKYGVTYQHTFVQVDANGNKIKLWSGTEKASNITEQVI